MTSDRTAREPQRMSEDKISIVVLTHNRKALLEDCLRSLLVQTYPREKLEIVVSDDGSGDDGEDITLRVNLFGKFGYTEA